MFHGRLPLRLTHTMGVPHLSHTLFADFTTASPGSGKVFRQLGYTEQPTNWPNLPRRMTRLPSLHLLHLPSVFCTRWVVLKAERSSLPMAVSFSLNSSTMP